MVSEYCNSHSTSAPTTPTSLFIQQQNIFVKIYLWGCKNHLQSLKMGFSPPQIYFYALLQIFNESLLLDEKRQTSQIGELNKYMAQNRDKNIWNIYLFNPKYFKYIFVWSKIFQMYICLIKSISNICLFNPTNRDSDLSRLPPSWGRQNLVDEHFPSNYRHLASWERGEDLARISMKILVSCFLGWSLVPEVLTSCKSSLVDNPLP